MGFLGDWLSPHGSESNVTSPENLLFNNAYVCYIEQLAAKTALVLGHEGDAKEYASAAEDRSVAIARAFYDAETGAYVDLLQTHIVMPLATGVVPNEKFEASMALLARAIAAKGGHLDVGLTGNYFLTKLLTEEWRNDLLFTITSKTTFPSYGFFLQQGYTTWPEQWDAQECCEDPVSKMHGCYNSIGLWFLDGVLGISVDATLNSPQNLEIIAGINSGNVSWARGSRQTMYGKVAASWRYWDVAPASELVDGDKLLSLEHNITLPPSAAATVLIPARSLADVKEGNLPVAQAQGVHVAGNTTRHGINLVKLTVQSGDYHFSSVFKQQ